MSEKMDLSYIGRRHGESTEGEVQPERSNQNALEEKKMEYMKKAFDVVWKKVNESEPEKYGILQNALRMKRDPNEHNAMSDRQRAILEDFIDLIKKQIYIDGYEVSGKEYPVGTNPRDFLNFPEVVAEYPNSFIEKFITDQLTQNPLN